MATHTCTHHQQRSALLIVWLVVFIDLLGFGVVLPVLPRQAREYLQQADPAVQGAVIGGLLSVFSLMQFVFAPAWGRWSDRVGRRPTLLLSLTGSVVFYSLYGVAVSLPPEWWVWAVTLMGVSRAGAGMAGASVGVAAAVIADCTPPDKRARGMALIGIAFGAGFTLGPLIAYFGLALFGRQSWGVGALAALLSLLALIAAAVLMPETRQGQRPPESGRALLSWQRTRQVLALPMVGRLIAAYFLTICAFAQFEATLALLTQVVFGLSEDDNFLVFAAVGMVLLVAGGTYRGVVRRWGEQKLLGAGLVLMLAGLAGVGAVAGSGMDVAPQVKLGVFYGVVATAVVGFACVNPSLTALVSRGAPADRQGEVLGVNQGFAALGRIVGPFVGSLLFPLTSRPVLPYVSALLLLGLAASLVWGVIRSAEAAACCTEAPAGNAPAKEQVN